MVSGYRPTLPWVKMWRPGEKQDFLFLLTANTKVSTMQTLEPGVVALRELAIPKEKNRIEISELIWDLTLANLS